MSLNTNMGKGCSIHVLSMLRKVYVLSTANKLELITIHFHKCSLCTSLPFTGS
eukprot:m.177103 g.177103  ORF g.177103 m.177103 type:complete len:53 (+) comp13543_c0_seq5:68-226(+)